MSTSKFQLFDACNHMPPSFFRNLKSHIHSKDHLHSSLSNVSNHTYTQTHHASSSFLSKLPRHHLRRHLPPPPHPLRPLKNLPLASPQTHHLHNPTPPPHRPPPPNHALRIPRLHPHPRPSHNLPRKQLHHPQSPNTQTLPPQHRHQLVEQAPR